MSLLNSDILMLSTDKGDYALSREERITLKMDFYTYNVFWYRVLKWKKRKCPKFSVEF